METPGQTIWNQRYAAPEYAYGEAPNEYLKEQLARLKPGKILFPADGEGRNGVHAATQSWEVHCFDTSREGRNKAMKLAAKHGVGIDYRVGTLADMDYQEGQFDAIALVYAHFPSAMRHGMHRALAKLLKPGGTLILEAFSKNNLPYRQRNPKVGGPPEADLLYTVEDLRADFSGMGFIELKEQEVELNEGLYHVGTGMVVRLVGKAK